MPHTSHQLPTPALLLLLLLLGLAGVLGGHAAATAADWEALLLTQPNPGRIYEHLAFFTGRPHVAGTPEDKDTALYTLTALQRAGVDARIETASVTLTYPVHRSLRATTSGFVASLLEPPVPEDPTSYDPRHIATHIAYSASGNVTGQLVYANYGRTEDYEELARAGVSVAGKIVLVRYGQVFRGVKVYNAEQNGAVACIIYSDPADDGYARGDVYPNGPFRPKDGVQRGSSAFLFLCPGDPGKIERCGGLSQVTPRIPALPISYGDAEPLLRGLAGPVAPAAWQGALPLTYNLGPGPMTVNLDVTMSREVKTVWNVIGEIRGSTHPNRRVVIGNHRDAWTPGATDPNSGTSTMLELARSFGELLKAGWRPARTLQFGSWDAEEYALIGSTEFGETNAASLNDEAIAYLNVDTAVTGANFRASGVPSLFNFIRTATQNVTDPASGQPLYNVWNRQVGILGSGSDYTVFLDKLGIACTDMSFSGVGDGIYHSTYDSLYWMTQFGDPLFKYHVAATQLWGLMTLRLLDANILPFDYVETTAALKSYFSSIVSLLEQEGGSGQVDLELIAENIAVFETAAGLASREIERCSIGGQCSQAEIDFLNDILFKTERQFLEPEGLPKRPWFKNVIFAPGLRTGYAASTFPGMVDAIYDHNWVIAEAQAERIGNALHNAAQYLMQLALRHGAGLN